MLIKLSDFHWIEADEVVDIRFQDDGSIGVLMASGVDHAIHPPVGRDVEQYLEQWAKYINANKAVEPQPHERVEAVRPA